MIEKPAFKNKEITDLWNHFHALMKERSMYYYQHSFQDLSEFIHAYKKHLDELGLLNVKDLSSYTHLREFKTGILNLLLNHNESLKKYNYNTITETHNKALENLSQHTPNTLRKREVFTGYELKNNSNFPLLIKKTGANFHLYYRKKRKGFYNIFRRLFNKTPLDLESYRRRRIPFNHMIENYLGLQFEEAMILVLEELMINKSQILLNIWSFDRDLEESVQMKLKDKEREESDDSFHLEAFKEIFLAQEQKIEDLNIQIDHLIDEKMTEAFQNLDAAMLIVDSPDLPNNEFKSSALGEKRDSLQQKYGNMLEKWNNTHKTLVDDWSIDAEIVLLYYSVLENFSVLHSQIDEYISNNLSINLEAIRDFINTSRERIEQKEASSKELKQILQEERHLNNSEFAEKLLAKTIHRLSGNINKDINKFKTKTMHLVSQISDRRGFVKNKNYEKGIKGSEINWLSPRELLNFEALPHFNSSIEEIEKFVHQRLEKSRVKLLALGTVCDFSLESAQMMLSNKKGNSKASVQVVVEGYGRALLQLEEASKHMEEIKVEPLENLQATINNFNTEIQKLKNTENVLELNMKIVKIKAIERSKKVREDAIQWLVNFIPKSIEFFKKQFSETNIRIQSLRKKMGFLKEKPHISHELSDFLKKTEISLKKLPFVYQRLYQLTPTDEDRFFVDREVELEKLQSSYEQWHKGRFIISALIGEKGSGITSLILYFLKKNQIEIPILHQEINNKIYDRQDYYQLFAHLLNQESFQSNEEIIHYLNEQKEAPIIILENLQHMYLKKVNGFVCQKMLFDLMASTSKNTFWICTYTTHSWEYLEKTLNISSIYTKEIHLEKMSESTIEELIFKRNYLSGYRVDFEASEATLSSKSYLKLKEQEKQDYLKKSFFKDLTQMSNGNVSLAQLYWLRSTHGVSDEALNIRSLRDFDVSFNKELPANYLFALHAILVHDGLNIEEFAQVFKLPEYICRNDLIPMLEKGLLMKPKEKYNINPIIFRQVVGLLRSHNFVN